MPLSNDDIVEVYRATVAELYGFTARRVGGDRELAEDIVQETYCRAVRAWVDKGLPDRPLAWLSTVAGNLIRDFFRRARPRSIVASDLESWLIDPRTSASPDAAALVQWGLARLRPERAHILQAFYFDGRSTRHIAAEEGASEKAIERRVARARQELRRHVARHMTTTEAGTPPAKEVDHDDVERPRPLHSEP